MENRKYRLTKQTMEWNGRTLHRIEAVRPFADVKAGDLGGWVESESNLLHTGDCWIYDNAIVSDAAIISEYAVVSDSAIVSEEAVVGGSAVVEDNAIVSGAAIIGGDALIRSTKDYIVFRNFWSSLRSFTWTRSNDRWNVGCFIGTAEELLEKAYKDSPESGKYYDAYVRFVELLKKIENETTQD